MSKLLLVLLALGWTAGAWYAGYHAGGNNVRAGLAEAQAIATKAREIEAQAAATKYDSALRDISALRAHNEQLAKRVRELSASTTRANQGTRLPANTTTTCNLSGRMVTRVNDITERCDKAAAYAAACRKWALGIAGLSDRLEQQ